MYLQNQNTLCSMISRPRIKCICRIKYIVFDDKYMCSMISTIKCIKREENIGLTRLSCISNTIKKKKKR